MEVVAVIDFETTGLSPTQGDRATEIAAVILQDGKVVARYQSLMNAGVRIPSFIQELTGISDAMIRSAPPVADVMREVSAFVGDYPLIAHNASFDCKFWDAELARINRSRRQEFACSMLLSRRLLPQAPATSSVPSLSLPTCLLLAAITEPWPMRKWPQAFWFAWKRNCVAGIGFMMSRMNFCARFKAYPKPS